ncbi:unnamed protein product [Amoebophrya sp. A25]|nr:unnamed protein product [Amoebophrya sp. A25]|eukprot:GSA25T00024406001.1
MGVRNRDSVAGAGRRDGGGSRGGGGGSSFASDKKYSLTAFVSSHGRSSASTVYGETVRICQNQYTFYCFVGFVIGLVISLQTPGSGPAATRADFLSFFFLVFGIYAFLLATEQAGKLGLDVIVLTSVLIVSLTKCSEAIWYPTTHWEVTWVRPILFTIPVVGISVQSFGACMALAFCVCHEVAVTEFSSHKVRCDPGMLLIAATIGGLLGAKLHYVYAHQDSDDQNAWWAPGLIWQGGAAGGTLIVTAFVKIYTSEQLSRVLDVSAPLLPLGHALGKIGCFLSGDGCYGPRSHWFMAMSFPNGRLPTKLPVHPTPLYELTLSALVFLYLWKRRHIALAFRSDQTSLMFILHATTRFISEIWRDHDHDGEGESLWPLNHQQRLCLLVFGLSTVARLSVRITDGLRGTGGRDISNVLLLDDFSGSSNSKLAEVKATATPHTGNAHTGNSNVSTKTSKRR